METLLEQLARLGSGTISEYDPVAHAKLKADSLNSTEGRLNKEDKYDCRVCRNKGYLARAVEDRVVFADCRCMEVRRAIGRMQRSGLKDVIRDYTFEKFQATQPWQKAIKEASRRVVRPLRPERLRQDPSVHGHLQGAAAGREKRAVYAVAG